MHAGNGSRDPELANQACEALKARYQRPSNEVYAQMLIGTVRNCVDVMVLTRSSCVLMGFRVNDPWKGHWHPPGGGQIPGDSYEETGALHMKRDLGLTVDPARLQFVNSASFPWSTSAQGVPCHLNGVLMAVELTAEEIGGRIVHQTGDFAESKFFSLYDVTEGKGFHPAIALGARILLYNLGKGRLGTVPPELLA